MMADTILSFAVGPYSVVSGLLGHHMGVWRLWPLHLGAVEFRRLTKPNFHGVEVVD